MSDSATPAGEAPQFSGGALVLGGLVLAAANFLVVLDTTIANVAVPHIAGGLAVSPSQGTYVITSYAVAEAVSVPLTGWLAQRFGTVKTFVGAMVGFGIFSALCGLAPSIGLLSLFRVFQGLAGGPLMPLSQTLLLKIFPPKQQPAALGLWSMTTLVAPIAGPIMGGWLCDNVGWPAIFYINVPIAIGCAFAGWRLLKRAETKTQVAKIDAVGLGLLILWVGCFQIMVDRGKELDWFNSPLVVGLGVVAAIGFAAFLIWELTAENPIIPLRVFRHRGFAASVFTISVAMGGMYSSIVLTPLWLQTYMGYTATWSGYATAMTGCLAVVMAPIAAQLSSKVDGRRLVFLGVSWLAIIALIRSHATTDMTFWQVGSPMLFMGIGMPLFFVPLMGIALGSVEPNEIAGASGLMNFARTMAGAVATSWVTTQWENATNHNRAELSGLVNPSAAPDLSVGGLDRLVQEQAVVLATNQTFLIVSLFFACAAAAVWLAPRPKRAADLSSVH